MRLRLILCLGVAALVLLEAATVSASPTPSAATRSELVGFSAGFGLEGTNGYKLDFLAYTERSDGQGRLLINIHRGGSKSGTAFYSAPAFVSESAMRADLGSLGRVDLALRPSGREKTIHVQCSQHSYQFEPGTYEGTVEFKGEGGYTRVQAAEAPLSPPITSFCGIGGGYGESRGAGLPGARIAGLSFSHDRELSFQVNKNHSQGKTLFTAALTERQDHVLIHREIKGFAPPGAFRFEPDLSEARLSLASPFSGSATLTRDSDSLFPRWSGNLAIDFPGRPNVQLVEAGMHVTIVHACFDISHGPAGHSC